MATLECRAAGTVDEAQLEQLVELLIGFSGAQPEPIEQHEVVLKAPPAAASTSGAPAAWKPDLRLQRDLQPPGSAEQGEAEPDTWSVEQYSLHLRGKQYAALPVLVRHVTRTRCCGDNVPAFFRQALGFAPRFQLLRRGRRFRVPGEDGEVEVSVSRVLRLPPPAADGALAAAAALRQAEEVSPGRLLVEASACLAPDADPMAGVRAVTALAALLQPHTALQRPPRAPGEPL